MPPFLKTAWELLRAAAEAFVADECMTRAAALAYYAALSFGPVLLIALWIGAQLSPHVQLDLVGEIGSLLGLPAGDLVSQILQQATQEQSQGRLAAIVSGLALLFSATGAFAQLQDTLNRIWQVEGLPPYTGVGAWLLARVLSLGMLLTLTFLAIVSLVVSAGITLVFPTGAGLTSVVNTGVGVVVLAIAFAGLFRTLPDTRIAWRDVAVGGLVTSLLFTAGKWAIGAYLGASSIGSTYGAAGSLLVLLVWVYYSSVILLFGAELTFAWACRVGRGVKRKPSRQRLLGDDEAG